MKRQNLVLMAVAALLGLTLTGTALAQQPYGRGDYGRGDRNGGNHDSWGNHDRFRAMTLEGRWVIEDRDANTNGNGFGFGRGRGMGDLQLPDRINIDQSPSMVRVTDRRNRSLQVIMLSDRFNRGHRGDDNPDYVFGRWNGSTLFVRHEGPRGGAITQTFALQNHGTTLVVKTTRERFNGRTVEFTNTYHRA